MKIIDCREEEEYLSIFENATEGIFQSSVEGRYLKVNPAMARIYGYDSPEDMVKSVTKISKQIHTDEATRKQFIEELAKNENVEGFEARNYRKDGSIIWTRTNARTVRDEKGEILYFEGFLVDITSHKEVELSLRASEERYRALVERLPGVVFLDTPDNSDNTIYVSPKIEEILGYSSEEWIAEIQWSSIIHPEDRERVLGENKRTDETGELFRQEYRIRRKDGEYIWIREESSLVKDVRGEPLFWQGFFLDISARKQAEDTILKSEEQFTKIFRSNPIASCIATLDEGIFIDANQAYYDLSGYQPDEIIGHKSVDLGFLTEKQRQKLASRLRKQKTVKGVDGNFVTKGGKVLNTLEFYEIIHLRNKDYILATFHDITGRVTALRALQESEERYRSLVELSPEAIAVHAEGKIVFINSAAMELMGATSTDELIGKPVSEIVHPDFGAFAMRRIQQALKTGETLPLADEKFFRLNGDVIDVEITSQPINYGGKKAMQVFVRDITARKKAEDALRSSESRYRALAEASNDMIFIISKDGLIEYVNSYAAKQFEVKPDSLINQPIEAIFPPEIAQQQQMSLQKVISSGQPLYVEGQTTFPNRQAWLGTWLVPLKGENSQTNSIMGVARDISEWKEAEQALKDNEQKLRSIIENTTNIYYSHTPDHLLTYMSPQTTDILGYDPEEALICWQDFLTENPINQEGIELTQKAIDTGKPQRPYVLELRHKDGHHVWVEVRESPIIQNGKTVEIVGALTDITERKRAEETLSHQLDELTILHNVALAASSSQSVDELIRRVTDCIGDTLYPDNCGVELVTESGKEIRPHQSYRSGKQDPKRWFMPISSGICGKVVRTGQTIRLGDVKLEPAYVEVTPGIQSELCLPIKIQERIIGVLNVESKEPDAYSEADERLLNTVAGTMATAIGQLQQFELSQRRLQELTILNAVSRAGTDSINADELIEKISQIIGASLYPDNFGVLLLDEASNTLHPHPSYRGITDTKFPTNIPLKQGVSGQVAATGKPLRIANVRNHKRYIEVTPQVRSELCVPIAHGEHILGVINAESLKIDAFTEDDEQLLTTIASTLATAIEKLRLFKSEQQRREDAENLREATTTLTTSLELSTLLQAILESLEKIIPYDSASITLERDGELEIVTGRGFPENTNFIGKRLPTGGQWNHLAANRQPLILPDVHKDKTFVQWDGSEYIRGWMSVPLVAHDKVIGAINLDSKKVNTYTQRDASIAQTFANSAAVAIENARLFEAEQQSRERAEVLREATDALTTSIELDLLYKIILNSAMKLVPFDSASIEILDRGYLEVVAGRGLKNNQVCIGERYPFDSIKWREFESYREPMILPNVQNDNRFLKLGGTEDIRGWMGVPMVVQDQLVGFLNFDSFTENFFTSDHAALAQTFGNQVAIAIANARLFQEESRRSQIIEAMANIANEFATAQELAPVLDKITYRSLELLHASTVAIYLLQDDNKTIKVVTALGAYREQLSAHTLQIGTGITGNIIANGKPEIVDDMFKDSRRVTVPGTPEEDAQNDTIMSAPLVWRGKTIGAINAWKPRSSGLFNQSELNFLVSIANQTSMLIESIRLLQETIQRAHEANAIAEVGRDISSTLQVDSVLERIAQYAKELLRAETSAVYLLDPEDSLLRAIAAIGVDAIEIKNDPLLLGKGILGNIAMQKAGEIVNNTLKDNRAIIVKGTDANPNEHLMGVPVLTKDQLTGLLAVWRRGELEAFKPFELDFLCSLAQQAAVAIENARLFEVEQRHFQEAETLRQAAEAITSSLDIQQVLNAILNNLSRVVSFDSAALFLIEGDKVRLTAGMGLSENAIDSVFPASNALLQKVWETGKPLILEDAQADSRFEKWVAADQVRGWMSVPLAVRGVMIGCITIDSYKPGTYNEHDATLASTFAHQAAAALENARLFERSEQQIRQLTVLRDIDSAISSSFDLRVTLDFLAGHAVKELNANAVTILLYKPDLQALSLLTQSGFKNKQNAPSSYVRIGEGLAGQVVMKRKLVQISDLSSSPEYKNSALINEEGFKSYFGIPLIGKGQVNGVLEIYSCNEIDPTSEWLNFLQTLAGQAAIAIDNVELFKNLHRTNLELTLAYDTTLTGWGKALELRDKETQGHTNRVVKLTLELARRMGVTGDELTHIMRGALLHDIGKMGIPDKILNKPGLLTEAEWDIMRKHPQFAYDLIYPISYLRPALEIPYGHHERWDGSGYPLGLKSEEIPLAARVFAVVDIWDALLNERVYREAWPEEKVLEYIKNSAGIELDPAIVEEFLLMIKEDHYKNQAE